MKLDEEDEKNDIERIWFERWSSLYGHHYIRDEIFQDNYRERELQLSWEGFLAGVHFEREVGPLQAIIDYGYDYDGLTTVDDLKVLVDDFVKMAKEGIEHKRKVSLSIDRILSPEQVQVVKYAMYHNGGTINHFASGNQSNGTPRRTRKNAFWLVNRTAIALGLKPRGHDSLEDIANRVGNGLAFVK